MRQFLTSSDLYSSILLLRSATRQALLLVEGWTDSRALSPHVNSEDVRVVVGVGKNSVRDTIELVDKNRIPKVVGLVDNDLSSHITTNSTTSDSINLVTTENYDLEADIFTLGNIPSRILTNFVDFSMTAPGSVPDNANSTVMSVIELSSFIGKIRLESHRQQIHISVKNLPFDTVLDPVASKFDIVQLSIIIKGRSPSTTMTAADIEQFVTDILSRHTPVYSTCCGHDLIAVMGAAMRKWWNVRISNALLENILRATLSCAEIGTMRVFSLLQAWGTVAGVKFWACT